MTVSLNIHYDANGNMTALINPLQIGIDFGYTANNQRSMMSIPLSGAYQYHYDRDRRIKDIVMPSGRTIGNVYSAGVLDSTFMPEGTIYYDYGCSGKLTKASFGGENIAMDYDGPLVTRDTRSGTLAESISYVYNSDYLPASVSYSGTTVIFGYDADGLLTSAGDVVISRNLLNGLPESVSSGSLAQHRSFSGYGELDAISWGVGGASPYQWSTARDTAGRIIRRNEVIDGESVAWEYAYDALGRLVDVKRNSALVESYSYDANGNRLSEMNSLRGIMSQSFSYSFEDHVITAGPDSYFFDVDGFMQSRTTAEGSISYEYSSRGELLRADLIDGKIITYVHDPMGRRIARQVNGTTVEKYLWAGRTTLLAVYDGNDNLLQRYTYADARMPVSMMAGGATYYLLTDQVGTFACGCRFQRRHRQEDRLRLASGTSSRTRTRPSAVPFGFAGGLHDRDTGLVRFGYRDYSPELGRFTAKDPIDFAGGDTNLYAYTMYDPVNFIDPAWVLRRGRPHGSYTAACDQGRISPDVAYRIAAADQGIDDNSDTGPWDKDGGAEYDSSSHTEALSKLNGVLSPEELGIALHRLQDSYAHAVINGKPWGIFGIERGQTGTTLVLREIARCEARR